MVKKSTTSWVIIIFSVIIGFLLRRYFLFEPGYEMDINTFIMWSNKITDGGFWSLYTSNYQAGLDYPPLIPYLGHYWLRLQSIWNLTSQEVFKLLPTLAEVIFSIVAALYIYRSKSKFANFLIPLVIIQPSLSLITSGWGQVDSVVSLFIIMGLVLIEKNLYIGTLFMFLALLTKPQAVLGIFVFYLVVLFRKGWKNALKQVGFFAVLSLIAYLIFQNHQSDFLAVYLLSSSRYPYNSMNAFNLWWLIDGSHSVSISDSVGSVLTSKQIGLSLFAVFLAPMILYLYKKAKSLPEYFLAGAYIYLIFFTFPTEIHERYLYPAIALIPFAAIKDKRILWICIILSISLFFNNYAVLISAFPQFEALDFINKYLSLGAGWTKAIALANVVLATYLALFFIYESFKKK